MKEIALTRGYVAWVDDEDFDELSRFKWYALVNKSTVAAVRVGPRPRRACIYMHRVVMEKAGEIAIAVMPRCLVDHRQHREDRVIDNRKSNLRMATSSENMRNQRKQRGTWSSFKGVTRHGKRGKWMAQIGGKYLGYFTVEAHAAYAYDLAAVAKYGEFALTNFPVPGSTQWLFPPS